jgi:hypothetical protein
LNLTREEIKALYNMPPPGIGKVVTGKILKNQAENKAWREEAKAAIKAHEDYERFILGGQK